jgi:transposase
MPTTGQTAIAVIGIDIGKNSFHIIGLDYRGAVVLRQKWSRGQVETRFANMPPARDIAKRFSGLSERNTQLSL